MKLVSETPAALFVKHDFSFQTAFGSHSTVFSVFLMDVFESFFAIRLGLYLDEGGRYRADSVRLNECLKGSSLYGTRTAL